jgi:hypothetical protein
MRSYYGCPLECPVTSNGLCNSHGHCAWDKVNRQAYCYCNDGYYGSSCESREDMIQQWRKQHHSYNGFSVELGLLVTLLVIAFILIGVVGYMVYRITEDRKAKASYEAISASTHHGVELSEHNF